MDFMASSPQYLVKGDFICKDKEVLQKETIDAKL